MKPISLTASRVRRPCARSDDGVAAADRDAARLGLRVLQAHAAGTGPPGTASAGWESPCTCRPALVGLRRHDVGRDLAEPALDARGFAPGESRPLPLPTSMNSRLAGLDHLLGDVEELGVVLGELDLAAVDAAGVVAPLDERAADVEELLAEARGHCRPGSDIVPTLMAVAEMPRPLPPVALPGPQIFFSVAEVAGAGGLPRSQLAERRRRGAAAAGLLMPRAARPPAGGQGRERRCSESHCDQTSAAMLPGHVSLRPCAFVR